MPPLRAHDIISQLKSHHSGVLTLLQQALAVVDLVWANRRLPGKLRNEGTQQKLTTEGGRTGHRGVWDLHWAWVLSCHENDGDFQVMIAFILYKGVTIK